MTEEKINNFLNAPINSMNLGHIENFNLKNRVHLFWGDESIGFLTKGKNIFSPIAECVDSEFLESNKKILIVKKLQKWVDDNIATILKPIKDNFEDSFTSADIRSVIFKALYISPPSVCKCK